jgi:predicted permease
MGRWLHILRLRLRSLLRSGAADRDLARELRSHIHQQIDAHLAAGLAPDEARRAALREFGPLASIEEACRDTRRVSPVQNVLRDLSYARRSLARHPALLFVACSSIALGIGANLTIFSLATDLLFSRPTAFRADRLVHIRTGNGSHVPYRGWRGLNEGGALGAVAGYSIEESVNWRAGDASVTVVPLVVTANFFDVLGVPFALGRGFTAAEADAEHDPKLVVISDGFWRTRLGGDPAIVGRALMFDGDAYLVTGVLSRSVRSLPGYGVAPDIYLPIGGGAVSDPNRPRRAAVQLIGRLRDGQGLEDARAAAAVAVQRIGKELNDSEFSVITVFGPVGGVSQVKDFKEVGAFFLVLLIVAGLVLAIACANVAGLLLAHAATRRREIAMRVALGASRARLVQQLLTEGLLLSLAGTAAGAVLTALAARLLARISLPLPVPVRIDLMFDGRFAAAAAGLVLLTTLLCALAPALHATRPSLVPALKGQETQYVHRRLTLRGLLVMAQIAVTVLLLVASVVFLRNLTLARALDPGFDTTHTVAAQLTFVEGRQGDASAPAVAAIVERIRALPGIEAAAFTEGIPLTIRSGAWIGTSVRIEGTLVPEHVEYSANHVGPGYFAAMDISVLRGREFTSADRAGAPQVAIINKEFADRYFAGRDPVGLHVQPDHAAGAPALEIVGVVANARYRTLGEDRAAAIYRPYLQQLAVPRTAHVIVRAAGDPEGQLNVIRAAVLAADASAAVAVERMSSALAFAFLPSRVGAVLFGGMGILGTVLAMIGLYGVVSFAVARRTAEIGVRIALGASSGAVMRMIARDCALVVGPGVVIGISLAALIAGPLAAFVVAGLQPGDPIHLIATALLITAVSVAAAWPPARRAVRIQPAVALRSE